MAKKFALILLLTKLFMVKCQDDYEVYEDYEQDSTVKEEKPNYVYSYGVTDSHTGDVKSVWEAKEDDTVKGHYSVLEPNGSKRIVEYTAGPKTGFKAVIKNEGEETQPQNVSPNLIRDKSYRDYDNQYDFYDDSDFKSYMSSKKKRTRHPFESLFKDYSQYKHPKHPYDLDPSEYTHSITIRHPHDDHVPEGNEPQSHITFNNDVQCKNKHKKENKNKYINIADLNSKQKYPILTSESYKENYETSNDQINKDKFADTFNSEGYYDIQKLPDFKVISNKFKENYPFYESDHYPIVHEVPLPDKFYPDEFSQRPKKKHKSHKRPETLYYPEENLDDYVLVPKKKYKLPPRIVDPNDELDMKDAYDRPYYHSSSDDISQDDRHRGPPRGPHKEVVHKIVKKRRPVINLLEIFDI